MVKDRYLPSWTWKAVLVAGVLLFCVIYYSLLTGRKVFTHDAIIWYGHFHYFVNNILQGQFPYWDPYIIGGSFFYPNMSAYGLLDPLVFAGILIAKIFPVEILTIYIYFRIFRLLILAGGAFFLFYRITGSRMAAALGAVILFTALPFAYFAQNGLLDGIYLMPFAMYFLLGFFDARTPYQKLRQAAYCAVMTGIMMNIHIPTFYLFNLGAFTLVLLLMKREYITETFTFLKKGTHSLLVLLLFVLVVLMAAPPLMVASRDASGSGELFPMLRIVQSNNGFKVMPATDILDGSLSDKFVSHGRAIFSSKTDLVRFLYPEMGRIGHPDILEISDARLYIGILPFLLSLLGILFFRSRIKSVVAVLLPLMFINGFSFPFTVAPDTGFVQKFFNFFFPPYWARSSLFNPLQELFNMLIPPLRMNDVRMVLSSFFLLYVCILMVMGFAVIFDREALQRLVVDKRKQVIALCAALIVLKVTFVYYLEHTIFVSLYDLFLLLQVGAFAITIFFAGRGISMTAKTHWHIFCYTFVACVLLDMGIYNVLYRDWPLQDSTQLRNTITEITRYNHARKDFQLFRKPYVFLPVNHPLAAQESIAQEKGAFTYGNNHAFFTTRRYYDLLTHVPLENQFFLLGIISPIVQFYPSAQVVRWNDKKALLNYYSTQSDVASHLFVEEPHKRDATVEFSGDFTQHADAWWLRPDNVLAVYDQFLNRNRNVIERIQNNPSAFINTPDASIQITSFSPNDVVVEVDNIAKGYLYYNDGWSKYWRVFDNGREVPLVIANYNAKAVVLEPGRHEVRFLFDPVHYRLGLMAYFFGLSAATGLCIYFSYRARQEKTG